MKAFPGSIARPDVLVGVPGDESVPGIANHSKGKRPRLGVKDLESLIQSVHCVLVCCIVEAFMRAEE